MGAFHWMKVNLKWPLKCEKYYGILLTQATRKAMSRAAGRLAVRSFAGMILKRSQF